MLDKALVDRRDFQASLANFAQLFFIVGEAAARSAQRVRRTHDDRIAQAFAEIDRFLHRVHDRAFRYRLLDILHQGPEQLAVFRPVDGVQVGSQDLDAILVQNTVLVQLDDEVQSGLTAQRA